jgi:hypothetical protein
MQGDLANAVYYTEKGYGDFFGEGCLAGQPLHIDRKPSDVGSPREKAASFRQQPLWEGRVVNKTAG